MQSPSNANLVGEKYWIQLNHFGSKLKLTTSPVMASTGMMIPVAIAEL
jgi:hypothetical protein